MPDGQVLEFSGVTKRFGAVTAVSDLSARVEPGVVTGFLGPNGAGKTTSLRMLLGLVRPTSGSATIGGEPYARLRAPLQSVGAALEASSFHPGRSGANHLRVYADAAGIAAARVDEVLALVGLSDAAGRKVGGYSLGMRQRLGLATALLGDPGVLVLDEPANGLDPEGIRWMRGLLRSLAEEGRTVLISSHLLAEVQQTVDALLIIAAGRLVFQGGIEELAEASDHATVVDAPDRAGLMAALDRAGHTYDVLRNGLTVRSAEPVEVGAIAAAAGIPLAGLARRGATLEDVFLELVNGERIHPSAEAAASAPSAAASAPAPSPSPEPAPSPSPSTEPEPEPATGDLARTGEPLPDAPDPAGTPVLSTEPDAPVPAGTPVPSTEPDAATPPESEPAPSTASFAVASTGVIDIVRLVGESEHPDTSDAEDPEPRGSEHPEHDDAAGSADDEGSRA
ncbi:ABC transporter ATP-binding protein [Microbacterium sp. NPDC091313]